MTEVGKYWDSNILYGNLEWTPCAAPDNTGRCFRMGSYTCEVGFLSQSYNIAKSCAALLALQSGYDYDVVNETRDPHDRAGSCYQDHRVVATGRPLNPSEKDALSLRMHQGEPPSVMEMIADRVVTRMMNALMASTTLFSDEGPLFPSPYISF